MRGDPVACLGKRRRLGAVVSLGRDRERLADRLRDRDIAPVEVRRDRADATRMVDEAGDRDRQRAEPGRSACRRLGMQRARVVERARPSVPARRPRSRRCESRAPGRARRRRRRSCGRRRCERRDTPRCGRRSRAASVGARPSSRRRLSRTTTPSAMSSSTIPETVGLARSVRSRDLGPGHRAGPAEEVEDDGAVVPAHHLAIDLGGACHQGSNLVRSANKGGAPTPATNAKRWRMSDRYEPSPDDHFTFGLWTVGNRGPGPVRSRGPPAARSGGFGATPRRGGCVRRELPRRRPRPPGVLGRRARGHREAVPPRARRHRSQGADGDVQPVLAARVPIGRVHRQRRERPPLRGRQDPRRHRPRRRARRAGLRHVGRSRRLRGRRRHGRPRRHSTATPRRSTSRASTPSAVATTCGSRSSPNRTNRAATSCCPPSGTCSRSSTRSSTPTWSG